VGTLRPLAIVNIIRGGGNFPPGALMWGPREWPLWEAFARGNLAAGREFSPFLIFILADERDRRSAIRQRDTLSESGRPTGLEFSPGLDVHDWGQPPRPQ